MAGNVGFVIVLVLAALAVLLMLSFAIRDRREGRALASEHGWHYESSVTRAPVPLTSSSPSEKTTYSHVVTAPDGARAFRRRHREYRWDGDPDSARRVAVVRLFVHVPQTDARHCAITWDPDAGVNVESGDEQVELAVTRAPFVETLIAQGDQHAIRLDVTSSGLLIETSRGAAVKDMPARIEWARSLEQLLPKRP